MLGRVFKGTFDGLVYTSRLCSFNDRDLVAGADTQL